MILDDRTLRRLLMAVPLAGLVAGLVAFSFGRTEIAHWAWAAGTIPVVIGLAISIVRDVLAGRMGVDAVAFLSMATAVALGETLAGVIVAIMYSGGNLLEDFAVGRAERDLKALVDRAPRVAHRQIAGVLEDVPIDQISIGDALLVRAGEVVPVDGQISSESALIDESALSGEPIPVMRRTGEPLRSGAINAGETFEMQATVTAGDSTYAGIIRMVTAAQTAKAPFMRMADRYALLLLPVTLLVAGLAWALSHDPVRALAVLVAATPCPLILAAPAAFIAGTSQAARRGILIKGGGPMEALARTYTVMFDKTGTLTVGGVRLVAIETAPSVDPDEALRLAASLEQASHHVLAAALVAAALHKGLSLQIPRGVREVLGSGLEGVIDGRRVGVGTLQLVHGEGRLEEWARRAARRASWRSALTVFVSVEGKVIAVLLFGDELRRETPRAIETLRSAGVARIVMVTGDRVDAAETIAAALDLDAVLADRVPADKVDAVVTERRLHPTLMVGDGINDAPALAAADVGIALGARGASASSEAADVVILVDRLDRVSEAVVIARRTRAIALQSIIAGMALSGLTMAAAAFGYVPPIAGALIQEAIDVAVILNALRALGPAGAFRRSAMPETATQVLREGHQLLEESLDRLRQIADALDDAAGSAAVDYILEANRIVGTTIVEHEREDEETIYPRVSSYFNDGHGLSAMSRAHREILHQSRLLGRLTDGLRPGEADASLVRDAQRIIESIEALVRIHNVQEEDIYEHASTPAGAESQSRAQGTSLASDATAFNRALQAPPRSPWAWPAAVGLLAVLAFGAGWFYWASSRDMTGVRYVTAQGVVGTMNAEPVEARVDGVIQSVNCAVGARVTGGQLCVKIDPDVYLALATAAKADLDLANTKLNETKAQLIRAQATYDRALERSRNRRAKGVALNSSRRILEHTQAQLESDDAVVARREAALREAETNLRLTNIAAPMDGTVISRNAEVGRTVRKGEGSSLFIIAADLRLVTVNLRIGERDLAAVRIDRELSFTVENMPGHTFVGQVLQTAKAAQTFEGNSVYEVVLSVKNPELLLQPGATVTMTLTINGSDALPSK